MRKGITFIGIGLFNILHASLHIVQFIQSVILIGYSTESPLAEKILDSPIFSLIMGIVGIVTLSIGLKDYFHHKKCH